MADIINNELLIINAAINQLIVLTLQLCLDRPNYTQLIYLHSYQRILHVC